MKEMKGIREFTNFEANEIRKLINKKLMASTSEQKSIRNKIRSFNFYFSDFSSKKGYTIQDFNDLIKSGQIKIIGAGKTKEIKPKKVSDIQTENQITEETIVKNKDLENNLIVNGKFCSIKDLNQDTLNSTGFYCIKLKPNSRFPERYQNILDKRKHKFIYIGKAEGQTLRERLSQELELKRPGTFFRSIGCVLTYLPITTETLIGYSLCYHTYCFILLQSFYIYLYRLSVLEVSVGYECHLKADNIFLLVHYLY